MPESPADHPIDVASAADTLGVDATPLRHILAELDDSIAVIDILAYDNAIALVETKRKHGHNLNPETRHAIVDFEGHFFPWAPEDGDFIATLEDMANHK